MLDDTVGELVRPPVEVIGGEALLIDQSRLTEFGRLDWPKPSSGSRKAMPTSTPRASSSIDLAALFTTWPFAVVPNRDSDVVWAGRSSVLSHVSALVTSFSYRPQSTLDLVWASFGSGKTHLLFFLEQQARTHDRLVPWYAVVPHHATSFSEVYRSLMSSFPVDALASLGAGTLSHHREIDGVLRALSIGTEDQKRVATDWLLGRRVDMRSAPRLVPLPYKLDTPPRMQRILELVLSGLAASGTRLLLMLDEYQRINTYRPAVRDVFQATLLDCFNATPAGLSVVFSCSAVQQAVALALFPPELTDRLRGRQLITLPEMTPSEAEEFVLDLLRAFRPSSYLGHPLAPFPSEGLAPLLQELQAAQDLQLIPRHIIQALDHTLNNAIAQGGRAITAIDLRHAVRAVQQQPVA